MSILVLVLAQHYTSVSSHFETNYRMKQEVISKSKMKNRFMHFFSVRCDQQQVSNILS